MNGPRVQLRCQAIKMANSPKRSIFILLGKAMENIRPHNDVGLEIWLPGSGESWHWKVVVLLP